MKNVHPKIYINHIQIYFYDPTIFKKVETFLYNMNIVIFIIVHYYIDTIIYYNIIIIIYKYNVIDNK